MRSSPLLTFSALYLATIIMLMGSSTFNTYMALYLSANGYSASTVGNMMALFYAGMVIGAKVGNYFISNIGHIRTYVTCAGIGSIVIVSHLLLEHTQTWALFRLILGIAMMCQYMVLESWLNDQAENNQRGIVFAIYMIAQSTGQIIGQLLLIKFPELDHRPLLLVSIFFSACLIPIAVTRRVHPQHIISSKLQIKYFLKRVPQSLVTVLVAGAMSGAFFGLAPAYGNIIGLTTAQVSIFISIAIAAGFLAQWPIGWISDRLDRSRLIQINAFILLFIAIPLWGIFTLSFIMLLLMAFIVGVFIFTFYPLAVAYANDHVEEHKRVTLSGLLLSVYGIGATIGPVITGMLMQHNHNSLFIMFSAVALILILWVKPSKVTDEHLAKDAPVSYVPIAEAAATPTSLDPRVDPDMIPDDEIIELNTPDNPELVDIINEETIDSESFETDSAESTTLTDENIEEFEHHSNLFELNSSPVESNETEPSEEQLKNLSTDSTQLADNTEDKKQT